MTAPFTVFVCSTFSDLSEEREGVLEAIRGMKLQHEAMELFGAHAEQPIETCLQQVRASDVLVVIVGHRYGSIVPGLGISYSEAEYAEASRLDKACLVYMRDENVPILPKHTERDPDKLKLLEKWKETLQSKHTIATFQDGERLASLVATDLERTIRQLEAVATARATARREKAPPLLTEVTAVITDALAQGAPEASVLSAIRSSVSALLGTIQKRTPLVFIIHSREDYFVEMGIAHGLRDAGIRVWQGLFEPGQSWEVEIEKAMAEADFIVYLISPNAAISTSVDFELSIALQRRQAGEGRGVILPVILADADVPPLLRQYQWIDLRDGNLDRVVSQLVELILHRSASRSR